MYQKKRVRGLWHEYQRDISDDVERNKIVKPRKKARHAFQSQHHQDIMTALDTAFLEKEGYITFRELYFELGKKDIFVALSRTASK